MFGQFGRLRRTTREEPHHELSELLLIPPSPVELLSVAHPDSPSSLSISAWIGSSLVNA